MASRAKKKANDINKQNAPVATTPVAPQKMDNSKLSIWCTTMNVVLTLIILFMLLLAPLLFASLKISTTGTASDAEQYEFNVTSLDAIIAPMRGCTKGFRFVLEKMGITIESDDIYQGIVDLVAPLYGEDKIEQVNTMGIATLVMSVNLSVFFVAMVALIIVDYNKKRNRLYSMVGTGFFMLSSLEYLIFSLAINLKTVFNQSTITSGWGIWILFFISLGLFAINIATYLKNRKIKQNENVQKV